MIRALFLLLYSSLASSVAFAQPIAIVGGQVHTVAESEIVLSGTVIIENGRITSVITGTDIPANARIIDATGQVVTPGFILPYAQVGLTEIRFVPDTVDFAAAGAPFSAGFNVSGGLNPDSMLIPVTRLGGITRSVAAPETLRLVVGGSGGDNAGGGAARNSVFAGQGAIIHLGGGSDLLVRPKAGVFMTVGRMGARLAGGARGAVYVLLRKALDDARHYDRNRDDYDRRRTRDYILPQLDLDALAPVVNDGLPLVAAAQRRSDILQLLDIAEEFDLNLVLLGAREGWKAADEIATAGVPVIVNPKENVPLDFESLGSTWENAARLVTAGVNVSFAPMGITDYENARILRQLAGIAVANGVPWDAALKAVTLNPATVWQMDSDVGSLEQGKVADVVVWDGDPFELMTAPTHIFINGRETALKTHQDRLRERYRDLSLNPARFGFR